MYTIVTQGDDIHVQPITLTEIDCRHNNFPQEGKRQTITLMESRGLWLTLNATQRQIFEVRMTYRIGIQLGLALRVIEVEKIINVLRSCILGGKNYRFAFYFLKKSYILLWFLVVNKFLKWLSKTTHLTSLQIWWGITFLIMVGYMSQGALRLERSSCWASSNYMNPENPTNFFVWWQKSERFKRWERMDVLSLD